MKYSELPLEYKKRVSRAIDDQQKWECLWYDSSDDLRTLFEWSDTIEGRNFWAKCHVAVDESELPPLPSKRTGPKHYSSMEIEPIDYILENDLGWCEANVVKYVTRHKQKGKEKDIKKAIHYLELLLEHEYNNGEN